MFCYGRTYIELIFLFRLKWFILPRYLNRRYGTINVIVFPPESKWVGEVVLIMKFLCLPFCLPLEFIHRCLLKYNVDVYKSSLQSCFEICFGFCEILCILLSLYLTTELLHCLISLVKKNSPSFLHMKWKIFDAKF